jgi:hypothetical protein
MVWGQTGPHSCAKEESFIISTKHFDIKRGSKVMDS